MGQISGRGPKSFGELRRKSKARRERLADASVHGREGHAPRNDLTPKLEMVIRRVDELTLPKRSVRKAELAHVAEIARSLSTFGQCRPIEIGSDNEVIDGAATLQAARQLGGSVRVTRPGRKRPLPYPIHAATVAAAHSP